MSNYQEWQPIEGYEGLYEISKIGRVKSLSRLKTTLLIGTFMTTEKILSAGLREGYPSVSLTNKGGVYKSHSIHRLLAKAFIPNPKNLPCINHINAIRNDNRLENLEWCTWSHNNREAYRTGNQIPLKPMLGRLGKFHSGSKPILQFSRNGDFIKEYSCASEAKRETGIDNKLISMACLGKISQTKGFVWKFKNTNDATGIN